MCVCTRTHVCTHPHTFMRRPFQASSASISYMIHPMALQKAGPSEYPNSQRGPCPPPLQALRTLPFLQPDSFLVWGSGLGMPTPALTAAIAQEAGGELEPARPPPCFYHPLVPSRAREVSTHLHAPMLRKPARVLTTLLLSYSKSKPSASPIGFIFKMGPESHFSPSLCHLSEPASW